MITSARTLLLAAATVMKATDLAKEVTRRATGLEPQPYLKSSFSVLAGTAAALVYSNGWRERVLTAGGVAAGAAVLHEAHAVLTTTADRNKVQVLRGAVPLTRRSRVELEETGGPQEAFMDGKPGTPRIRRTGPPKPAPRGSSRPAL